jgi:hypothetical protein
MPCRNRRPLFHRRIHSRPIQLSLRWVGVSFSALIEAYEASNRYATGGAGQIKLALKMAAPLLPHAEAEANAVQRTGVNLHTTCYNI